jgi:hypothetical protein
VAPAGIFRVDQIGHAAHRLDAAGDDDLGLAEQDRLGPAGDRLHAGGAGLVERLRGSAVGQPGPARDLTGRVGTGSCLPGVPDEHFVHEAGVDAGPFERRRDGDRPELGRVDVPERPAVAPNRRARRADDHDLGQRHNRSIIAPRFQLPASSSLHPSRNPSLVSSRNPSLWIQKHGFSGPVAYE